MSFLGVDTRGIPATAACTVGDDFSVIVVLFDLTSGAVTGSGATIVAAVSGVSMTVDYATQGRFVCTLTETQTASIGSGVKSWVFKLTPSGGASQTYVDGSVLFSSGGTNGGSTGWQAGIVNGASGAVAVVVA